MWTAEALLYTGVASCGWGFGVCRVLVLLLILDFPSSCPSRQVGGLGDVVTGLARACLARGHRVEVLLPFYECIDTSQVSFSSFDFDDILGSGTQLGEQLFAQKM